MITITNYIIEGDKVLTYRFAVPRSLRNSFHLPLMATLKSETRLLKNMGKLQVWVASPTFVRADC